MYLDGGEVSNWCTYVIWIVNTISAISKAHTLFFCLVWIEIRDKATISDSLIVGDSIRCNESYCVCPTNTVTDSLCQASKFICKSTGPYYGY